MPASENNQAYHPFLLERFRKAPILSGMPKSNSEKKVVNLSHNLNYFSQSIYRDYPSFDTSELSKLYIQFLKREQRDTRSIEVSFLQKKNLYFASITKAIYLIIKAFCTPDVDEIAVLNPTFPLYEFTAMENKVRVNKIELEGYDLNMLPAPCKNLENYKCIFICNPNNPTGTLIEEAGIIRWLKTGILVVVDEAYIEYSNAKSLVRLLKDYPNLIIMRTFSKAWGMAGIRSGVIVSSESVIQSINRVDLPFDFSSLAQNAVCDLLSQVNLPRKIKEENKKQRERLTFELAKMSFVKKIYPSETCFIFLQVEDSQSFENFLLENNISTNTQLSKIPNTIRISIGDEKLNFQLLSVCAQYDANGEL